MNKFATVDLYAPQQTHQTRRFSSVVRRPQNQLRTAPDVRPATRSWPHWGAQKNTLTRQRRRRSTAG